MQTISHWPSATPQRRKALACVAGDDYAGAKLARHMVLPGPARFVEKFNDRWKQDWFLSDRMFACSSDDPQMWRLVVCYESFISVAPKKPNYSPFFYTHC
jgi:hypothetical protein